MAIDHEFSELHEFIYNEKYFQFCVLMHLIGQNGRPYAKTGPDYFFILLTFMTFCIIILSETLDSSCNKFCHFIGWNQVDI